MGGASWISTDKNFAAKKSNFLRIKQDGTTVESDYPGLFAERPQRVV